MKKYNLLLKAFVIIVAMLSIGFSAFANQDFEFDGIWYKYLDKDAKTVAVAICSPFSDEEYQGRIVIPSSVSDDSTIYTVTEIDNVAFHECINLTSITIPNSITKIGNKAFYGCSGLTSVTIPNSVTKIGDEAFAGCSRLSNITIPDSVTSIGGNAFRNCIGLTDVYYNAVNCIDIGRRYYADGSYSFYPIFSDCSSLKTLNIGKNVTNIPYNAFSDCKNVTTINFNAENCASCRFGNGRTALKNLKISYSVKTIPNYAFQDCASLTEVNIPNSVTSIGSEAFAICSGLTEVAIGDYVTTIGNNAFSGCSGLTEVNIPNSVTSIGSGAFANCSGLTEVNISDLSAWCKIVFYNSSANPLYYAHHLYLNGEEITDLVIPDDITEIKNYVFSGCSGLTSVTIGDSVTSIGESAFYGCSGLTEIKIPDSVTEIGGLVFFGCTALKKVTIGNSITKIGTSTFGNCKNLNYVNIFDLSAWLNINFDNDSANPLYYGGYMYLNDSKIKTLIIPEGVTEVKQYAFYNWRELTSIKLPNSVTKIGAYAFSGCTGLTEFVIPDSVTEIGEQLFWGCKNLGNVIIGNSIKIIPDYAFAACGLTEISIPNSVSTIGSGTFHNCRNLAKVNIGKSVKKISIDAFHFCENLTSIIINKDNSVYDSRNNCNALIETSTNKLIIGCGNTHIPNSVTTIGNHAFEYCTGLTSVTIPNSVTEIGNYAFEYCTGLTSITIPNSVTEIGNYAFEYCTGLTSITIPNSSIGRYTFHGCTALTDIIIGDSVTKIGRDAFYNTGWYNNHPEDILYLKNCCLGYKGERPIKLSIKKGTRLVADYAFGYCWDIEEVVTLNFIPPICGDNSFVYNAQPILKVPAGAKEAYSAAEGWSQFTNIIEIATVEVSTQGDNATFEIPTAVDAVKYTVKVYSDAEMTQLIATANYDADGKIMPMSTSLELSIDGFADGTYYYSVSALSENGVELENHTGEFVINVATGIGNASIENKTTEVARYDIYGRLLSKPTKGVNIVKMSDGTTKKLIIKN